jgi:hypothetical protein
VAATSVRRRHEALNTDLEALQPAQLRRERLRGRAGQASFGERRFDDHEHIEAIERRPQRLVAASLVVMWCLAKAEA